MKRRAILTTVVAVLALALIVISAPKARAQCCTYRITIPCVFAPICYPITFTTNFGGALQTDVMTGCGSVVFPIIGCPPVRTFNWISPDGGATRIALNQTGQELTINGCPFICIKPVLDAAGCVEILLWSCPAT